MLLLNSSQGQLAPGSVVLDQSGAVVGLTTPRRATTGGLTPTSADAVGEPTGLVSSVTYATPIDFARKVADDIIDTGSAQHAWLGVHGSDIEGEGEGAEVQTVVDQSPAAVAGPGRRRPRDRGRRPADRLAPRAARAAASPPTGRHRRARVPPRRAPLDLRGRPRATPGQLTRARADRARRARSPG